MVESLQTIEAKIKKQVKLLEIAECNRKRLFERKKKCLETCLGILEDLKYEGQERMVVGDEKDETVNVGKCCELLDERLVRSDEFVGQLKEELSIASYRDEAEAIWKENLIQEQRITRRREKEVKIEEIEIQMIKKGSEFSSS